MSHSIPFLLFSTLFLFLLLPSTFALSPVQPSPIPLLGHNLLCVSTTSCLACPPSEMQSQVCKLWGNRRQLSCSTLGTTRGTKLNKEKEEIPQDPDRQVPSHHSTTTPLSESTFYSYEPSETALGEEEEGELREEMVGLSKEDKAVREEELREAVNAERQRRIRRRSPTDSEEEEEEEEVSIWEACPRIVKKEQSDYFEFLLCNLFFGLSGLGVLLYRQRLLAGRQFGKLAARIMQTEIR
ncbi:hypothetical protein JCM5353_000742 [Sporobolomyces roseus]